MSLHSRRVNLRTLTINASEKSVAAESRSRKNECEFIYLRVWHLILSQLARKKQSLGGTGRSLLKRKTSDSVKSVNIHLILVLSVVVPVAHHHSVAFVPLTTGKTADVTPMFRFLPDLEYPARRHYECSACVP